MEVLEVEDLTAYLGQNAYEPKHNKSIYSYVVYDIFDCERPFAYDLDMAEDVKVFAKLQTVSPSTRRLAPTIPIGLMCPRTSTAVSACSSLWRPRAEATLIQLHARERPQRSIVPASILLRWMMV